MRVVPPRRGLNESLPRRLRWTRAHVPTRRRIPRLHRPEGRAIVRPSARVSLLHLLTTLAVALVIWGTGAIFQTYYTGRIYPHVTIDHVPVGGMTHDQALAALRDTETARLNAPIYVQAAEKIWQVTPAQFGARYNIGAAVDRALTLAHSGPFLLGGWDEARTIWNGANVPLSGTHDPSAISRFLAQAARAVHVAPRGAMVGVRGADAVILRQPRDGRQLDLAGAAAALGSGVNTHAATAVTLPLQPVESALGYPAADAALRRANALLAGAPIQFVWPSQAWQLPRQGLARLLSFTPRCASGSCRFDLRIDVHKLAQAFNRGGVASSIDRAPTRATYELVEAGPSSMGVRVLPDSQGIAINVAGAAAAILQGQRTIPVPTVPLFATFNTAAATALNFDTNVGASVVSFPDLTQDWARLDNLNIAANTISDTIVQPGQTFRVAGVAGPLTPHYGYIPGQNKVGPSDITGVNSGVDLLASAVLSAAYDAGLPIVQRTHYPYLNVFTLPGFDAVVTYDNSAVAKKNTRKKGQKGKQAETRKRAPVPDLVVRNTSDHPLLVMTSNDGAGGVGIYIFNSAGYAPSHQRGAYQSSVDAPQVTLNPDGSVDASVTRHVAVGSHTSSDRLSSHYAPIDP